ncbi:MAG: ABC transporter ATP-binding protein [Eubacteriales bacterium]|jgi:ATP-binding cassette subfamily B protein
MLPLDKLDAEAKDGFSHRGVATDELDVCIELDLDEKGNFGTTWLAVNKTKMLFYAMSVTSDAETVYRTKKAEEKAKRSKNKGFDEEEEKEASGLFRNGYFKEYDWNNLSSLYVDNYVSSNRVLGRIGKELEEPKDDAEREKAESIPDTRPTITLAYCTNARKRKLFAFLDIVARLKKGDEVKDDDPIFDQFQQKCPKCGKVYKDQNRKICDTCTNQSAVIKRLLKYFTSFKVQLIIVLFCLFATSGISLLSPVIHGQFLYDQVIAKPGVVNGREIGTLHSEMWVYIAVGIIFLMALLSLAISILQNRTNAHLSTKVALNMKLDIFTAMQKLSLSYFNSNQTGRLITRVNYDADRIRAFFIDGVPNLIINGVNFIGLTIFLFMMNWQLTLIVFIPVPLVVLMFKFMLPKLWRMYTKLYRRSSSLNAVLGDSLNGIRVVKAFAKETDETNRFYGYAHKHYEASLQLNTVSLMIFPVIGLLIAMSSKAIWGFGGFQVMNGYMTYGQFTTYFGYLGMIFGPLNFFTNFSNMLTDTMNSAQRMFEVIDAVPEITDAPDAVEIDRMGGEIEFKKVCFHYAPNRPILKDMTFHIKAGDQVGLVGHTGAGKSTIANLISRLYDTISGSISIDGLNVKQIKGESMRKNIAIVSQEIYLFRGTIADNIRYAKPDATMEEVIASARVASAHDFILSLPDGYETIVGTGSRSLSGGEKQRISIARALLLNPTILILDEATAAMDTETERLIQDALDKLVKGRTTITIAHRLSTLKECNYLYVIDNGEIAEEGTHSELIEKKGTYYRLYTLQTQAMRKVLQGM